MTRAKRNFSDDTPAFVAPDLADRRPKLVLLLGRGSRGKTMLSRWMIDRAENAGRHPLPADGDRTNQTLARYHARAVSPPSADDADVRGWVAGIVEGLLLHRHDTVLDLGGGDLTLKSLAREMDLLAWLTSLAVEVVPVHVLGPSLDDVAYLQSVEEGGLLASPTTILVLNEGVVPVGRTPHAAFSETVQTHAVFASTIARGARLVSMPRLEPAPELEERGMPFLLAAQGLAPAGEQPLGPWKSQQVTLWLRRMEANFASVLEWLP